MTGIIDEQGQQWEPCNHCGKHVKIQDLTFGPSPKWPDYPAVDLCKTCALELNGVIKHTAHTYTVLRPEA